MKRTTRQYRRRLQKRHVKERKAKARAKAAHLFRLWKDRPVKRHRDYSGVYITETVGVCFKKGKEQ